MHTLMKILAINAGSTSIKFKLFIMPNLFVVCSGIVNNIGKKNANLVFFHNNYLGHYDFNVPDHKVALELIINKLLDPSQNIIKKKSDISAIGHRVVHMGHKGSKSLIIDKKVLKIIEELGELAPLHNPPSLACIKICMDLFSGVKNIGVFDTTFHKNIPEKSFLYPIPYKYYMKYKVRKFGFHGIAYNYIIDRISNLFNINIKDSRIIALMLGGGSSIIAFKDGKTIDTSMGFTPMGGDLPMSTRSGDLDPGLLFYLMKKEKIDLDEMNTIINKKSGIYGLSGRYSDFKNIVEGSIANEKDCKRAFNVYTYMIKKYIGSCAAVMNGVNVVVFGGGIGESSPTTREAILNDLDFFGIKLDNGRNNNLKGDGIISTEDSKVKIIVVKVDEEYIIAKETYKLII